MITNQKYVIGTFLYNFKLFVKDLKYSGDHRNKKNNSKFPLNTFQNSHDGHRLGVFMLVLGLLSDCYIIVLLTHSVTVITNRLKVSGNVPLCSSVDIKCFYWQ